MATIRTWITTGIAAVAFASLAVAQNDLTPKNRQVLKQEDVPGTNMEIILSVAEYQPGDILSRHIHHGEEGYYVIQGAALETLDGKKVTLATGAGGVNHRDVPHGGLKVVGDTPVKLFNVHVVDKGLPLYDAPPK